MTQDQITRIACAHPVLRWLSDSEQDQGSIQPDDEFEGTVKIWYACSLAKIQFIRLLHRHTGPSGKFSNASFRRMCDDGSILIDKWSLEALDSRVYWLYTSQTVAEIVRHTPNLNPQPILDLHREITHLKWPIDIGRLDALIEPALMVLDIAVRAHRKGGQRCVVCGAVDDNQTQRLRARLELILDVFQEHGCGPFRGKRIAELSRLDYDSHLRTDLSELRKLGFLTRGESGYQRSDKPYPMS